MKIIFISDLHFGVHANSYEWLDIQEKYYNEWFIPLVKKTLKQYPETIIFCLGDVFDNKQTLNVRVLNSVMSIFKNLSDLIPIYSLVGNHDIFVKVKNNINSLKPLSLLDNVTVIEEPEIRTFDNAKIYFMPWRANSQMEKDCIKEGLEQKCDYIVCHTDFTGIKYNRFSVSTKGNSLEEYKGFKKVFSGHIHWRQEQGNLIMVGNPHQQNGGDRGNQKGIYILDTKTDEVEFIENTVSPKYLTIDFGRLLDMDIEEFEKKVSGNFIILKYKKEFENFPFYKIYEGLEKEVRSLKLEPAEETQKEYEEEEDDIELGDFTKLKKFNLIELMEDYIKNLEIANIIKERLINESTDIFNDTLKTMKEEF